MTDVNDPGQSQYGIVVGIDGTKTALEAVRWAADEAVMRQLPLQILHAAPYADLDRPAGRSSLEVSRARAILAQGYTIAHHAQPALAATTELVGAGPANALADASARAELLVLGMRGTGALGEVMLSSVALEVSGLGHCPVVVVRGARTQDRARVPVVIGVGDDADDPAIGWAFEAALLRGAPLIALHAVHGGDTRARSRRDTSGEGPAEEPEPLARHINTWHARYPAVEARRTVLPGRPAELLLDHSTQARLVVVGTRARGSVARALLGSTSRVVLRHSACPVAVIRPGITRGIPKLDAAPTTASVRNGR